MRKQCISIVLGLLSLWFVSCNVEFSPNASWQEIPVVYCVLDQDADTTFVRVQKCYLGEGNNLAYSSIMDSVNYPQGSIEVKLLAWKAVRSRYGMLEKDPAATTPKKEFAFDYFISHDKIDGAFCSPDQPLYICSTAGLLDTSAVYQLLVIKNETGDTIASSFTSLVGNYTDMSILLRHPNNNTKFQFSGSAGNGRCSFEWLTLPRARQYQPTVRFYYRDFMVYNRGDHFDTVITPHYLDILVSSVKVNLNSYVAQTNLDEQRFLSAIKDGLKDKLVDENGDTINRNIVDSVDIYIKACTEELAAYLFSQEDNGSINQDGYNYSNIIGGKGVFAARRAKVFYRIATPPNSDSRYKKKIKELGVGF